MPIGLNILLNPMPRRGGPAVGPPIPSFGMLPRGSILKRMMSNFAECITAPPRGVRPWQFAEMFRSAYFPKRFPTRPLLQSVFLHVSVLTILISLPPLPSQRRMANEVQTAREEHRILYYTPADRLPPVSPLEPQPPPKRESPRVRLRAARGPERVVSRPPRPDNARQTIVQPEAPQLKLPTDVELPNLVAWSPVPPPPPSVSDEQRQLAALRVPRLPVPDVAISVPAPVAVKLPALPVPQAPVAELPAAPPVPTPVPPKLTLPEAPVPAAPSAALPAAPVPPRPSVSDEQQQLAAMRLPRMPTLVAVGIAPAPPAVRIEIPLGNRAGEFAISPEGEESNPERPGQSGNGSGNREDPGDVPTLPSLGEVADLRVPDLSIAGDRSELPPPPVPVVSEAPEPSMDPRSTVLPPPQPQGDLRTLMARATRPALFPEMPRGRDMEAEPAIFGDRHVYTMYINMPNLASGAGSWILRFAERDAGESADGEISSPVAVKKVDPKYTPDAARERVEGTVTLAAEILRSGRVAGVKVVHGLDPRLDLSAVEALTLWQFEPARRKGVPIDLEVTVQIPFRLPAL